MKDPIKTNRLAIMSFASGLIALTTIILVFVVYNSQEISGVTIGIVDGIIMPGRNLSVAVALITGILALRELKIKNGTEKGKIFAWIGVILGAGWMLIGLLVGLFFLLGEILH